MNSGFPSREIVERIRREYPIGTRIELVQMEDTGGTTHWYAWHRPRSG